MPKWKFHTYKMSEPAQCEADSIKSLGDMEEVCEKMTSWAVKSPRGTFDYAVCKAHRQQLTEKGLL